MLEMPVELVRFVDSHDLQDLDQLLILADLIKYSKRSSYMQSVELEFKMRQLFISAMPRERVLSETMAFLLNEELALLLKL